MPLSHTGSRAALPLLPTTARYTYVQVYIHIFLCVHRCVRASVQLSDALSLRSPLVVFSFSLVPFLLFYFSCLCSLFLSLRLRLCLGWHPPLFVWRWRVSALQPLHRYECTYNSFFVATFVVDISMLQTAPSRIACAVCVVTDPPLRMRHRPSAECAPTCSFLL